jgi:hypothetical protein
MEKVKLFLSPSHIILKFSPFPFQTSKACRGRSLAHILLTTLQHAASIFIHVKIIIDIMHYHLLVKSSSVSSPSKRSHSEVVVRRNSIDNSDPQKPPEKKTSVDSPEVTYEKRPPPLHLKREPVYAEWQVQDGILVPTLPELHPLAPTAAFVPQILNAQLVATRITKALRTLSIQASYEENEAMCRTSDGVSFGIFLYRGKQKYSHGVIVEVQRWSGFSFEFQNVVTSIFLAAQGSEQQESVQTKKHFSFVPLPVDIDEDELILNYQASVQHASKLLATNQDLALQLLSSMTRATKMGETTANMICQSILGDSDLSSHILRLVPTKFTALQVLVNISPYASVSFHNLARPVLLEVLKNVETRQQETFLALECFMPLEEDYGLLHRVASIGDLKHAGLYKRAVSKIIQIV